MASKKTTSAIALAAAGLGAAVVSLSQPKPPKPHVAAPTTHVLMTGDAAGRLVAQMQEAGAPVDGVTCKRGVVANKSYKVMFCAGGTAGFVVRDADASALEEAGADAMTQAWEKDPSLGDADFFLHLVEDDGKLYVGGI